jgi:predicted amidohydrolase
MRLAVAASQVQRDLPFAVRLDRLARAARAQGADMLLLAEYFLMEAAAGGTATDERDRAATLAPAFVEAARDAAMAHGLFLCPGSFPVRDGARVLNRAPLIAPDGTVACTGKHRTTGFEAGEFGISPDPDRPQPVDTPWGQVGIAICYDSEFPPLTRALAAAGAFLVLVPACTDTRAGWTRVEISARAAAIQHQCFVAVAPTIGLAPWSAALDVNTGRAAIFCPADRSFPDDGIIAAAPMDADAMLVAELDPAWLAAVRRDGAVRNFADWPDA